MVGQWTVTKPSRSDEVLDADQQLKIANQVRARFDSLAPKRPTKPNRSEPDSTTTTDHTTDVSAIPELHKLRSLQSQSHEIYSGEGANNIVGDEFVETLYYKELVSIDKEHHRTGSGFIRVMNEGDDPENGYNLHLAMGNGHGHGGGNRPVFKSNPATNDWIPIVDDQASNFTSSKPNRSEDCHISGQQ